MCRATIYFDNGLALDRYLKVQNLDADHQELSASGKTRVRKAFTQELTGTLYIYYLISSICYGATLYLDKNK